MTASRTLIAAALALGAADAAAQRVDTLVVRNHHAFAYRGAVELPTAAAAGEYTGPNGAAAVVRGGVARVAVSLAPGAEVRLVRSSGAAPAMRRGPLAVTPSGGALALTWSGRSLGTVDLALVVRPGTTMTTEDAVREATPLSLAWRAADDGTLHADGDVDGYAVSVTAVPYGAGSLDVTARVTRSGATGGPAYVALVRRVTTPAASAARLRFNGRTFDGARSPDTWDRDFWYVHGVDWLTWRTGDVRLASINGFTPVPTTQRKDSTWGEGSHFWVWERTRTEGDRTFLVAEIAGPNADQAKSAYMPVTPYAPMRQGDAVDLRWRLAAAEPSSSPAGTVSSDSAWAESQLRVFAGYRNMQALAPNARRAMIDLGAPAVQFGTSYFPYSTMPENFDYVRTPGLDREVWWAFSPTMWARWREFAPQVRTDLHIISAMGFAYVRLHHLELLQQMPKADALAFLDFYFREVHALGLRVLIDSEGPEAWISEIAGRYKADIARIEVENEVLLYGIKPKDATRLAGEARAAKAAAPNADVFFTSAGNNGVFERLRQLDVPFDRVGLHAYKHGPQWMETYGSHVLGTADYAASIGKVVTLGEFNWKSFGRISDEKRAPLVRQLYETVLLPRAIPELFEFHFAETQSINTVLARDGTRHYEPLRLDRRPKPEARELMQVMREYVAPDAPVRALPVTVAESRIAGGRATARFTVTNATARVQTVRLSTAAFDPSLRATLGSDNIVRLAPGATHTGSVTVSLTPNARPGAYHHFVQAAYAGGVSIGWGIAMREGAPTFAAAPVLGDRVTYPQGPRVVDSLDWTRPLAVTFADSAPVLEMESAHTLANTLQSATGRTVWLSSVGELPDSLIRRGTLVVVGTAARDPRLGMSPDAASMPTPIKETTAKKWTTAEYPGVVTVQRTPDGRRWLLLAGANREAVQAAATDVVLRFWPNAKDAAIRLTGTEPGAALGKRAGTNVNADLP